MNLAAILAAWKSVAKLTGIWNAIPNALKTHGFVAFIVFALTQFNSCSVVKQAERDAYREGCAECSCQGDQRKQEPEPRRGIINKFRRWATGVGTYERPEVSKPSWSVQSYSPTASEGEVLASPLDDQE